MPKLVQITDLHLHAEPHAELRGADVDAGLDAVLAHIRAHHWPLDGLLATGDLIQDDPAAYPRLRQRLTAPGVPVYCLPGNHDRREAMAEALAECPVQWRRQLRLDGWQVLLLDSVIPGETGGRLGQEELAFLDRTLTGEPDRPALVCLHHHPVPTGVEWLDQLALADADALFTVLDRHPQVRGVIWGHVHQHQASLRNGMQLLGTPATSCQFTRDDDPPERALPGYRWLELAADGRLRSGIERVAPVP